VARGVDLVDQILALDPGHRDIAAFFNPGAALDAARALRRARRVLIITGFTVELDMPETDGPPGVAVLGRALRRLGARVTHVTDAANVPLVEAVLKTLEEPTGVAAYPAHAGGAARFLADEEPTHLVAIERPGRNAAGDYLNMRGDSVAAWNQPLDELFMARSRQGKAPRPVTVGIGDGGNEIRMGNVRSRLDLLHTPEIERRLIEACVSAGACDGVTRRCEPTVDSLGADIHAGVVDLLRLASRSGIMGGGRAGRRKRS
jgi:hypothetical protein